MILAGDRTNSKNAGLSNAASLDSQCYHLIDGPCIKGLFYVLMDESMWLPGEQFNSINYIFNLANKTTYCTQHLECISKPNLFSIMCVFKTHIYSLQLPGLFLAFLTCFTFASFLGLSKGTAQGHPSDFVSKAVLEHMVSQFLVIRFLTITNEFNVFTILSRKKIHLHILWIILHQIADAVLLTQGQVRKVIMD